MVIELPTVEMVQLIHALVEQGKDGLAQTLLSKAIHNNNDD